MGERRPRLLRTDPEIDKVTSMITVRLYTIGSYIQEAAESGDAGRCAAAGRARALVDETKYGWPPTGNGERNLDALHERLDCLEELVPALVSDDRLGAMLEAELTRPTGEDGYVRIGELFDETTTRQLLESLRAGGSEAAGCRPSPRPRRWLGWSLSLSVATICVDTPEPSHERRAGTSESSRPGCSPSSFCSCWPAPWPEPATRP